MIGARRSLRRLTDCVADLVDPHVGIIEWVREVRPEPGGPNFFHFTARASNTAAFSLQENFRNTGGASSDRDMAMAKAIGEAVERYCAAIFRVDDFPLTSYNSAPFQCVPPGDFALYSPAQYAEPGFLYRPFEGETPVRWTAAFDPLADETWHVAAAMVYVPYYYYLDSGEAPIAQPISTGLACHVGQAEAAIGGICEVVERDSFCIAWQARISPPRIIVESLSDANSDLVRRFERTGAEVTLLQITTDAGIPAVLSVLRQGSPDAAPFVVAASADPDPERAVRKSLEELEHTRQYCQQIKTYLPRLAPEPGFANVVDQMTHLNFWCDHAHSPLGNFLLESDKCIGFDEIENLATGNPGRDLMTLCRKIRAVGHRALLVDLTTPDVMQLGLSVVRAIVPGFQPLCMGYTHRCLGGDRLWDVPRRLGYPGLSRESGDNPTPHPYP